MQACITAAAGLRGSKMAPPENGRRDTILQRKSSDDAALPVSSWLSAVQVCGTAETVLPGTGSAAHGNAPET